jgi:rSAM/selenodomain-associated transferase 2
MTSLRPLTISVILPTLNEADALATTVAIARDEANGCVEVIISDCGSTDATRQIGDQLGRVVAGGRNRADAQNRGAAAATGDVLLFLHADTRLPAQWDAAIRRRLQNPAIVGGAFDFRFSGHRKARGLRRQGLRIVQVLNRIRFRMTGCYYGDQAIFCRRETFDRLGGFRLLPVLEDADFSRRMLRLGRTAILQPPVKTSPRRFLDRGIVRQMMLNWSILGRDLLGLPLQRQATRYRGHNHNPKTVTTFTT